MPGPAAGAAGSVAPDSFQPVKRGAACRRGLATAQRVIVRRIVVTLPEADVATMRSRVRCASFVGLILSVNDVLVVVTSRFFPRNTRTLFGLPTVETFTPGRGGARAGGVNVERLTEQVSSRLTQRLLAERERRGMGRR